MTREDWGEFLSLLNATEEITVTQKPISDDAKFFTFNLLSKYTLDQIKTAVANHLQSERGQYFPKVCDIKAQIEGSENERGLTAWGYFLKVMDKYGVYDSVVFPNPAFHYAIEMLGGWQEVTSIYSRLTAKELDFKRNVFISYYLRGEKIATFGDEPDKVKVKKHLPGLFETDNAFRGYDTSKINVEILGTGEKVPLPEIIEREGKRDAQLGSLGELLKLGVKYPQ